MEKFYCQNCKTICDAEDLKQGTYNYVPYGMTEVIESIAPACPNCGSENIYCTDIIECKNCGTLIAEDDAIYDEYEDAYYCEDCIDDIAIENAATNK